MSRVLNTIVGVSLIAQVSMAQPAGPTAPGPAAPAPPTAPAPAAPAPAAGAPVAPGAPPAQVDISVPQRSTLSPQDMITQARDYRGRMNEVVSRINVLVEGARKQKDIIRLNCLMDKLVQVRANVNIADQAVQSLQEAIARRDDGASVHEYTRLTIVNQKVQVLGAEAEACVGEDLSFVGATRVDVEIDPGIANIDPAQPTPPPADPGRPPAAEPTGEASPTR